MSQTFPQPTWHWGSRRQKYYYYDLRQDDLVYEDGFRVKRPNHIAQGALVNFTAQRHPSKPGYSRSTPVQPQNDNGYNRQQPKTYGTHHGALPSSSTEDVSGRHLTVRRPSQQCATAQMNADLTNLESSTIGMPENKATHPANAPQQGPEYIHNLKSESFTSAYQPSPSSAYFNKTMVSDNLIHPALVRQDAAAHTVLSPPPGDTERLFHAFKKRSSSFFAVGRVFLVLWSEPVGDSNLANIEPGTSLGRYGEHVLSKVRRFVVIREGKNYCSALPILSYGKRGVSKLGVNKSEHTIVHTGKESPPALPAEKPHRDEQGMRSPAIRVTPDNTIDKLDPLSRLHFARVHTIEQNIKVMSFGMVHEKSRASLLHHFRDVWTDTMDGPQSAPSKNSALGTTQATATQASVARQVRSTTDFLRTTQLRSARYDGSENESLKDEGDDSESEADSTIADTAGKTARPPKVTDEDTPSESSDRGNDLLDTSSQKHESFYTAIGAQATQRDLRDDRESKLGLPVPTWDPEGSANSTDDASDSSREEVISQAQGSITDLFRAAKLHNGRPYQPIGGETGFDNRPDPSIFTDEGYCSLNRSSKDGVQGGRNKEHDDDDIQSIRTDNRDTEMALETKTKFAAFFAEELIRSLELSNQKVSKAYASAVSTLPKLLHEFSVMIEHRARPGFEERAVSFVRHRRV